MLKCVALNAIVQEINKGELHTLLWELDMMSKTYYYWGKKKRGLGLPKQITKMRWLKRTNTFSPF